LGFAFVAGMRQQQIDIRQSLLHLFRFFGDVHCLCSVGFDSLLDENI
jgi:hypothetical protein